MLIKSFHQLSFLRDFMTNFLARLCCATQKYLKHKQKKKLNEMKKFDYKAKDNSDGDDNCEKGRKAST